MMLLHLCPSARDKYLTERSKKNPNKRAAFDAAASDKAAFDNMSAEDKATFKKIWENPFFPDRDEMPELVKDTVTKTTKYDATHPAEVETGRESSEIGSEEEEEED